MLHIRQELNEPVSEIIYIHFISQQWFKNLKSSQQTFMKQAVPGSFAEALKEHILMDGI